MRNDSTYVQSHAVTLQWRPRFVVYVPFGEIHKFTHTHRYTHTPALPLSRCSFHRPLFWTLYPHAASYGSAVKEIGRKIEQGAANCCNLSPLVCRRKSQDQLRPYCFNMECYHIHASYLFLGPIAQQYERCMCDKWAKFPPLPIKIYIIPKHSRSQKLQQLNCPKCSFWAIMWKSFSFDRTTSWMTPHFLALSHWYCSFILIVSMLKIMPWWK